MDAIFLRPQPGHATVRFLSKLLFAAPIAVSITLASHTVLRHWQTPQVPPSTIHASNPDAEAHPVAIAKSIPTLQVPPGIFAQVKVEEVERTTDEADKVLRMRSIKGVSLDESGLTTGDGGHFELDGVVMPEQDARCRRLDGVTVSCRERVAARLEILRGMHAIDCQFIRRGARVSGQCHAGKTDLAEDLLRNGLVRRAGRDQHAQL